MDILVTTFYRFVDLADERESLRAELLALPDLGGMVIIAPEGLNGTIAGTEKAVAKFREALERLDKLKGLDYKDSRCHKMPFRRWKIELKQQAILYKDECNPSGKRGHLSPSQWKELMDGDEEITILDTRNTYEVELGTFQGAIDPKIDKFTEFSDFLEKSDLPKNRKTLIFCTGGIRCEKAILDMEERGFEDVCQLDGGILKYLEEYPDEGFDGECFVFDKRVAVNQSLQPTSNFWLCPHCGDPGTVKIPCGNCREEASICQDCQKTKPTCSKDCQYHWLRTQAGPSP